MSAAAPGEQDPARWATHPTPGRSPKSVLVSESLCLSFPFGLGSPQLTWQTRQTVTVLDVVQEPTGSESCKAGCCWGIGPSHRVPPPQLLNAPSHSQPSLESTPMRCRCSAGQLTAGGRCCAPHSGAAR